MSTVFKRLNVGVLLTIVISAFALTYSGEFRWIGHGIVSVIGLVLAIGAQIAGAMLAGRIKKMSSGIFQLHRRVSLLYASFMVGTFVYGLWVASQHDEPLLTSVHGRLGLVIAALALLQVIPSLVIEKRTHIRFIHMILGYSMALLVLFQSALGLALGLNLID